MSRVKECRKTKLTRILQNYKNKLKTNKFPLQNVVGCECCDNLLIDHVELSKFLDFAVHLDNFVDWMGKDFFTGTLHFSVNPCPLGWGLGTRFKGLSTSEFCFEPKIDNVLNPELELEFLKMKRA